MSSLSIDRSNPTMFTHFKRGVQKTGGKSFRGEALPNDYKIVVFVRRLFSIIGACLTGIGLVIAAPFVWIGTVIRSVATPGKVYTIASRTLENKELEDHLEKVAASQRKIKTLKVIKQGGNTLEISKEACRLIGRILPASLIFDHVTLLREDENLLETPTYYYMAQEIPYEDSHALATYVLKRKISMLVLPESPEAAIDTLRKLAQAGQRVIALHHLAILPEEYVEEKERLLHVIRPVVQTYVFARHSITPDDIGHALHGVPRIECS